MVTHTLIGQSRSLGGDFTVRRVLPQAARRMVGPFVFVDHMGPIALPVGEGFDVRPHPHINLATVTYLFEGELIHRDSLGSECAIVPGDLNWMNAGSGIVHSERSSEEARRGGVRMHGMQLWVALPTAQEESAPTFQHVDKALLPTLTQEGVKLCVIAGEAYGARSPVTVLSSLFYVDAELSQGATLMLPDEHAQRAAYVVSGEILAGDAVAQEGTMLVFDREPAKITATQAARVMLLGGAPLDGERHISWNFVSSSLERIERAKKDWKDGRFAKVKGDEEEFIPLPE